MNEPVFLILVPLLAAFILPVAAGFGRWIGPAAVLLTALSAWALWERVAREGPVQTAIGGFTAPVGIALHADGLAVLMTLTLAVGTLILWPRRREAQAGTPSQTPSQTPVNRQAVLTLLLLGGGNGLALSGDLFNVFVFYEIVAVASYGLAASNGSGNSLACALRYLVVGATGSALALLGIAMVYAATGVLGFADLARAELETPLGLAAFSLIVIGFGVKAELFPFNTWVPEVYQEAPGRVSGLLAGFVSKLALLVILRLLVLVFTGQMAHDLIAVLGILGIVGGELAAWRAPTVRQTLAYSSISQLGLAALAFALPGPAGVLAGTALILHHMTLKPALFLLSDRWGGRLATLEGGAAVSPLAAGLFVLFALSMLGVPPLPGFWSKFLLLRATLAHGEPLFLLGAGTVLAVTVVEAAYLFRIIGRLFRPSSGEASLLPASPVRVPASRIPAADLAPALALGGLLITGAAFAGAVGTHLNALTIQAADREAYISRAPVVTTARGDFLP